MKITVDAVITDKLFLRQCFAQGTAGADDFELCATLPGHFILLAFGEKQYVIKSMDIVDAILEQIPD